MPTIPPPFPDPVQNTYPSARVRLANGQTSINPVTDIVDTRLLFGRFDAIIKGGWPFENVLTVHPTDPEADFDTIQDAILGASCDHTILVAPGTYAETLGVDNLDNLTIMCVGKGSATVDLGQNLAGIGIDDSDNFTSQGFNIVHDNSAGVGGAVTINVTSSCDNCQLLGLDIQNDTSGLVAAIGVSWAGGTNGIIRDCSIRSDKARIGSALNATSGDVVVIDCELDGSTYDLFYAGVTVELRGTKLVNGLLSPAVGVSGWRLDANGLAISDNLTLTDGKWISFGPSAARIEFDDQATDEIVFKDANVGINVDTPEAQLDIKGSAINSGPASFVRRGANDGCGFAYREVFQVSITASAEISRITGTGQNGFAGFVRITVTGHTGAQGNGGLVREYSFSATTVTQVSSTDIGGANAPSLTLSLASDVLTISLASSDAMNTFTGVMEIVYYIPPDFSANTWAVS